MTNQQQERAGQLEIELRNRGKSVSLVWQESTSSVSRGFIFSELRGVTITCSPSGLLNIPAVRSYHPPKYPTPVIAAACADELWAKQSARDEANPKMAITFRTGHLGPLVNFDLKCQAKACDCASETDEQRQKRAQGGFNTDPDRCS
jgi:hypothetical protein